MACHRGGMPETPVVKSFCASSSVLTRMKPEAPTLRTFAKVWGALMILLLATILVAQFDLGRLSLAVALAIAVTKAVLIILFFMHVRYGSREVLVFAGAAYLWVAILMAGTLYDYATRNWVPGGP